MFVILKITKKKDVYIMISNMTADRFRQTKDVSELTDSELMKLGKIMAESMLDWTTNPNYEPWEFDSEELPYFIDQAKEVGLIHDRKSHTVKSHRIVYDED